MASCSNDVAMEVEETAIMPSPNRKLESSEPHLRIPGILVSSYNRIMQEADGKSAPKRIRVDCGVCKQTRCYSTTRGITRVSGVVACEGCRHFYQRFKREPSPVHCNRNGKCYLDNEINRYKCKACWAARIICHCPVPLELYQMFCSYLPESVKMLLRSAPPKIEEVPMHDWGNLGLEVYRGGIWEDVTDRDGTNPVFQKLDGEEESDGELQHDLDVHFDDGPVKEPGIPEKVQQKTKDAVSGDRKLRPKTVKKKHLAEDDLEILLKGLTFNNQNKFMENFNPNKSKRNQRKSKAVSGLYSEKKGKGRGGKCSHDSTGHLVASSKDICDCLSELCPGCHFPCNSCGSGKCGIECRNNRKWHVEYVQTEGGETTKNRYA